MTPTTVVQQLAQNVVAETRKVPLQTSSPPLTRVAAVSGFYQNLERPGQWRILLAQRDGLFTGQAFQVDCDINSTQLQYLPGASGSRIRLTVTAFDGGFALGTRPDYRCRSWGPTLDVPGALGNSDGSYSTDDYQYTT